VYLTTDINPAATIATKKTGVHNGIMIDPIQGDLVSPIIERMKNAVDILIFNPPYVVTPSSEVGSNGIEAAWAGGINGREVLDRFLPYITVCHHQFESGFEGQLTISFLTGTTCREWTFLLGGY
jgi:release factor glutamine methyltransferase